MKKKLEENCNFPKNEKLQFSSSFFFIFFVFFSFFFYFFHFFIIFHHFCFQWCKNFPKNKKVQFSSSFFFIFLSCFFIIFIIFASSGGIDEKWSKNDGKMMKKQMIKKMKKINEKQTRGKLQFSKKWKIAIFLEFFIFFHFFHFFSFFFIFFHFCFIFFIFFHFFFHFLSFFIIFASSGAKIFRKIKKLQFSSSFFHFFYHFFFIIFLIIFASSGGIDHQWSTMMENDKKW